MIVETNKKKQFVDEFKSQWTDMWRDRFDDKVRAEGIANKDYSLLSVEKGTVIIATRKFRLLDLNELLQKHKLTGACDVVPPDPSVGGWGRFARTFLSSQRAARRGRQSFPRPDKHAGQQLKKGGRGWLHTRK